MVSRTRLLWVLAGVGIPIFIAATFVYLSTRKDVVLLPELGDRAWAPEDVIAHKQRIVIINRGEPEITILSEECTISRGTMVRVLSSPDSGIALVRVTGDEENKPTAICQVGSYTDVSVVKLRRW